MTPLKKRFGFTLIELMIVISIIGILSAVIFASFSKSRSVARDDIRKSDLKNLQVALALYKAQNGSYPKGDPACDSPVGGTWFTPGPVNTLGHPNFRSCDNYIYGLVPDFIAELPKDPISEGVIDRGIFYQSNGSNYKLMYYLTVENNYITSFSDDFARCPATSGNCQTVVPNVYAVYSPGAINW